jgi:hypothetical protein
LKSFNLIFRKTIFGLLITVAGLLAGCNFLVEREAGKVVKSLTISDKGLNFLLELRDVPSYSPERMITFWCNSAKTTGRGASVSKTSSRHSPKADWAGWTSVHVGPAAGMVNIPSHKDIPSDRVKIVTTEFAFIDMGTGSVGVTFDGCDTNVVLSNSEFYGTLFRNDELKHEFQLLQRPLVSAFRLAEDGSGVCFRLNPWYVKVANKGFDVCSANRGVTWYSKEVNGSLHPPSREDIAAAYSIAPKLADLDDMRRLFKKQEVKLTYGEKDPPPFYAGHRLTPDTNGICSRISTGWLVGSDKGFDVCTADSGKTWYAKEAKGLLASPSADDAKDVYSATTPTPTFTAPAKPVEPLRNDALNTSKPIRADTSKPIKADR